MYRYLDYEDVPAVLLKTEKGGVRGIKLVNNKWKFLSLADVARQGYVLPEKNWRKLFEKELKDAPEIPKY
jgi:hypothetical protein